MERQLIVVVFVLLLSIFLHDFFNKPVWTLCDTEKCPYCYGTDFCENIQMNNVALTHGNIHDIFLNYLSVKNVYKGVFKNESVVLKKLGHNSELDSVDDAICLANNLDKNCVLSDVIDVQNYEKKILDFLNNRKTSGVEYFKSCNEETSRLFLDKLIGINSVVARENYLKNVWTTLQMNVEPLILQLFNENFPVPFLYGSCGRMIVVKDAGDNLNAIAKYDWIQRAFVALQLMRAAKAFTEEHDDFRFYLTDINPDNIAVNERLKVSFIDLENVIMISKYTKGSIEKHRSSDLSVNDNYSYDEREICNSTISDHNFLAICSQLLSDKAPYPMMTRGLLHDPPNEIRSKYPKLFANIKYCESPPFNMDRFKIGDDIIAILEEILTEYQFES